VAAQNAYFHRPLTAPITAGEPVTGRYQAIVGPWTHGENVNGAVLDSIRLEWLDTWLKGERTGMAAAATPLHIFENTASQRVDAAAWPPSTDASAYYLGAALLPNFTLIPAGDRIQVVLTSQPPASFHLPLTPTPQELASLAAGTHAVENGGATPSVLDLPLTAPGQFTASPTDWGPSS
jgi:hypothetical protein